MLAVAEFGNQRTSVFDLATKAFVRHIGSREFGSCYGCAILQTASEKLLFVSDNNHKVTVFNFDSGAKVREFGSNGSANGQFKYPVAMTIFHSPTGPQLLVSDSNNHRVQVHDALTGNYIRTIGGGRGNALGQLNDPYGIALLSVPNSDITWLIVCDSKNKRLQVFDVQSGNAIKTIGNNFISYFVTVLTPPNSPPLIFASDYSNHRVRVFDALSGDVVRDIGNGNGANPGQLSHPFGLSIFHNTAAGRYELFINEANNHRVSIFDALTGQYLGVIGKQGRGNGELIGPYEICLI